tara:strand:- start:42 stop:620 length:579 start_codon:yes stop_codon:yes gene_type:complete
MAQTSTTILAAKSHKSDITGTDIRFNASSGVYTIATTTTSLSNLAINDLITISGASTSGNNSTFTVKEVATDGLSIKVHEVVTTESAGQSITIDHVGFVSSKFKGDGYFSKPDGMHTVSYKVSSTLTGSIKMQGSLATDPGNDDWFNIGDTQLDTDQSSTMFSYNFTGNFVWIRARATSVTAGTITSILLNS